MGTSQDRCKSCGVIFADAGQEIDKCQKKKLYCELCVAQKNPRSATEQKIKKKYLLLSAGFAFIVWTMLIVASLDKNKGDNLFGQLLVFGIGYAVLWAVTALLSIPLFVFMRKPHKARIKQEKERYVEEIEIRKKARIARQEEQAQAQSPPAS